MQIKEIEVKIIEDKTKVVESKKTLSPLESIFNPEFKVTNDNWYVSLAKHSSLAPVKEEEHAFLIIQTPNRFYRRELYPNRNNPGFAKVVSDTRMWETDEEFQEQVRALVWRDENVEQTMDLVANNTWPINKAQGLQLLEDIKKDISNPPRFFINGNTSILKEGEIKNRCMNGIVSHVLSVPISSLMGCISAAFVRDVVAGGMGLGILIPIPPLAISGALCVAATTYTYMLYNAVADDSAYSRQHNCATWCIEKLTNLNISCINKDIKFYCSDKLAYITGLHIYTNEEDRMNAQKILDNQVDKKLGCYNTPTV